MKIGFRHFVMPIVTATFIAACSGTGIYSTVTADSFVARLNQLEPYNAYSFTVIKDPTRQYGHVVFYDAGTDEYRAIDMVALRTRHATADDAARAYLNGDLNWLSEDVYALGWNEYQGDITGLIYETTGEFQKDLIFFAKMLEETKTLEHGKAIAENFGLSETQGVRVATLAHNWEKLAKTREVTTADADAVSQQLFGFSLAQISDAEASVRAGDSSKAEQLIAKAAAAVETTPENVRALLALTQGE